MLALYCFQQIQNLLRAGRHHKNDQQLHLQPFMHIITMRLECGAFLSGAQTVVADAAVSLLFCVLCSVISPRHKKVSRPRMPVIHHR